MGELKKGKVFFTLMITFFLWGSSYVASKMIVDKVSPVLLSCLRCLVAAVPLGIMARKYFYIKIEKGDRKYFILIAVLGYFVNMNLLQLGVFLTGASTASLITSLTPVAVAVFAAIILKEKITGIKCICIVLALSGAMVIAGGAGGKGELLGIFSALLSTISWGVASVYIRKLTVKYPVIFVTACSMFLSLILLVPAGAVSCMVRPVHLDIQSIAVVLYIGIFSTGIAQFTWAKSLSILPASTCSLFHPMQAVFSALMGIAFLGEQFQITFLFGFIFVALDVFLCTWETIRQKRIEETRRS